MSKVARSLSLNDFHASYKKKMAAKGLKPKNIQFYRAFVEIMGDVYMDRLLTAGIVGLPWNGGDIYLKDKNTKPARVFDGPGKSVLTFNDNTGGVVKTFFWRSMNKKDKKLSSWSFSAHRDGKRQIKPILTTGKVYPDYHKMLNYK